MLRIFGRAISSFGLCRPIDLGKRRDRRHRSRLEELEGRIAMATDTFVNPSGGDWFVASNWSIGIPQAGSDVVIPSLSAGATVTYGPGSGKPAISLHSLSLDGSLTISGLLTVMGNVSGKGSLALSGDFGGNGGILSNANVAGITVVGEGGGLKGVTLGGNATVVNGPPSIVKNNADLISVTGGLTINGNLALGNITTSGSLDFSGTQTIGGTGTIVSNGGSLSADTDTTLTLGPDVTMSGNVFGVDGTVTTRNGAVVYTSAFVIQGAVVVQGDNSLVDFDAINVTVAPSGQLAVGNVSSGSKLNDTANVIVTNTLQNSGLISLGSNSKVQVGYPGFSPTGFTQTGSGTLSIGIHDPPESGHQGYAYLQASSAVLGGTLSAALVNGYDASFGQTFVAVSSPQITGRFASFNGSGLGLEYTYPGVTLSPTNPTSLSDIDTIYANYSSGSGVLFDYIVSGNPGTFTFGLYQSNTPNIGPTDTPLLTTTVTNASNMARQGYFDLSHVALDPNMPYLVVAADPPGILTPNGQIHEFNESNNDIAIQIRPVLKLDVITEPSSVVGLYAPFDVKVAVEDANGNIDTGFSGYVQIATDPFQTTVLGGVQKVLVVDGVADFPNLTVNTSGPGYKLKATADGLPAVDTTPFTVAFTPAQIRKAYGFDQIPFLTSPSDPNYYNEHAGQGQTIAILVIGDYSLLYNDVSEFDDAFGLPYPPNLLKIGEDGGSLASDLPPSNDGTANAKEEILDVEWAHALAPAASIVVVECKNDILDGVAAAANHTGVTVVSMSYGDYQYPKYPNLTPDNYNLIKNDVNYENAYNLFTSPPGRGITFIAASGDYGNMLSYPAISPNVLSVGGTSLALNADGSYGSEIGWNLSGGGEAGDLEPEPAYQTRVQDSGSRSFPDVAFDANPSTAVSIFISKGPTSNVWDTWWGTSLGAPCWAALIALADQERVATFGNGNTLDGRSQTLPALYNPSIVPSSDFNRPSDFAFGDLLKLYPNNNTSILHIYDRSIYDEDTGLGTPKADLIVPALASLPPLKAAASGLIYNRATQLFGGTITLTNTGKVALDGLIEVVLTGLPSGVTLANASGYTPDGNPYLLVDLRNSPLAAGRSLNITVLFANPKKSSFQYGLTFFNA